MSQTFGERLRFARKNQDMTGPELARRLSVSAQTLSEWERDKYLPTADKLPVLAAAVSVTIDWLLTGREQVDAEVGLQRAGKLVPKVSAQEIHTFTGAARDGAREMVPAHFPCGPRSFQWTIIDRSNGPAIDLGDSVIIDPDGAPEPGDMVLVIVDGKPLFRKWKPRGKRVLLEPLNQDWEADNVPLAAVTMKGVMTEHTRPRRG